MIIHFGLSLDGMQPVPPATAVGAVALGPARMLDVLETQLGLPPVFTRPGEVLSAYQNCLAQSDGPDRFYHRSFAVDPIGVARTLLDWRHQCYEAGWQGRFSGPVSSRLVDMADVERLAESAVPLSTGQRLARIDSALADGLKTPIERIVLHDDPAELPRTWRTVLARFTLETAPGIDDDARAGEGTDLRKIQDTLVSLSDQDEGEKRPPITLKGDNSVIVVRGVSRDLTAQALGEFLIKSESFDDTVFIAERDGIIVDNALERVGLPRAGFQHYSRFRAVTQVLKLALGLVWEPVSPHLLLQFLIHPTGPLPRHVRSTLAEAVAAQPGIGGEAWHEALKRIDKRMRERFDAKDDEIRLLKESITSWLEPERFSPTEGAPLAMLIERTQRCLAWLAQRLNTLDSDDGRELFGAALAQGEALIVLLTERKGRGEETIDRLALEKLVDEIAGHAPDPGTFAQAGHVRATSEPAAITTSWDTVIWWDLAPHTGEIGYPWSDAELAELAANGVTLPSAAERIRYRARVWLRPIMNARSQLILVIHDRDEGHHPLWNQLTSLFDGFNALRIEDHLLSNDERASIPALEVPTGQLERKRLPRPKRWWGLPQHADLGPRPTESYSSLQKLIYYPHQWVLHYPARLRPGRAADLSAGNLLYGSLAHRLFERFFDDHRDWHALEDQAVRTWLADCLPDLITREGAVLHEPGFGVTRQQVSAILERAFHRLLDHLRQAGIEDVRAEYWMNVPFEQIEIAGGIDLLLTDRRGEEIVLDVKWGGERWRGEELTENRYLQLATYAYMRSRASKGQRWPEQAYFIVSTGNILARDNRIFADAVTFSSGGQVEPVWQQMVANIRWRRDQLAAGQIEVNVPGTEPSLRSTPPDDAINVADTAPDKFDDFARVTGWEDGA